MRQATFLRRLDKLRVQVVNCGWDACLAVIDASAKAEMDGCFSEAPWSPSRGCRKTLLELIESGHEGHLAAQAAQMQYAGMVAEDRGRDRSELTRIASIENSFSERKRGGASRRDVREFRKKQSKYAAAESEHAANMAKARQAIDELRGLAVNDLSIAREIVDEARRQHRGDHAA